MDRNSKGFGAGIATIEDMRRRKRELGYSYEEIVRRSGLPLGTVQKVLGGFTRHPRSSTLQALDRALFEEKYVQEERESMDSHTLRDERGKGAEVPSGAGDTAQTVPSGAGDTAQTVPSGAGDSAHIAASGAGDSAHIAASGAGDSAHIAASGAGDSAHIAASGAGDSAHTSSKTAGFSPYYTTDFDGGMSARLEEMLLHDGAPVYNIDAPDRKRQGEYTIADRAARPEKYPSELIDGVIYDMTAPTFAHQMIAGEIYSGLRDYIRQNKGDCIPFMAAADVRLDRDDRTMVMPDVFVVCDRDKIVGENGKYLDGAPDLVVEVVSPSTRKKDMGVKLEKYRKAGVREYWMVDYVKRKVIIWTFGDDPDVSLYGFEGEIPVGIYGGDCRIDFNEIARQLRQIRGWDDVK